MTSPTEMEQMGPNELASQHDLMMDDEEFAGTAESLLLIRRKNAQMLGALDRMGLTLDFQTTMLKSFFGGLVGVGVITKAQLLLIELTWENNFHSQLEQMIQKAEQQAARAEIMHGLGGMGGPPKMDRSTRGGLLVPGK